MAKGDGTFGRMEKPQIQAEAVRNALKSTAASSSTTLSTLRNLLNTQQSDKENIKPESDGKNGRTANTRSTTRPKAATASSKKATSEANSRAVIHAHEENVESQLSAKEKYTLAQEVVNISLRSLTNALRSQPSADTQASSKHHAHDEKSSKECREHTSASDGSPLKQLQVNSVSKKNLKASTLHTSCCSTATGSQDPAAGVVAVAECARTALAYLRLSKPSGQSGKALPAFQLENGMLAFIGKLVNLRLDTLAIKELCVLKSRLEKVMAEGSKGSNSCGRKEDGGNGSAQPKERETLATLLFFDNIDTDSPALPIIVNHQLHVLRLISAAKRSSVTEAVLEYLTPDSSCCPASVILRTLKLGQSKEKAAHQLQSLSQIYLSLCPSTSRSEDAIASNMKTCPSPQTVLTLQYLAFETKIQWWNLANHQADIGASILEPYIKCLDAFATRSSNKLEQVYNLPLDLTSKLQKKLREQTDRKENYKNLISWASLESLLSTLAQNAGDLQAAMCHVEAALIINRKIGKPTEQSVLVLRLGTLAFELLSASGSSDTPKDATDLKLAIGAGLDVTTATTRCSDLSKQSLILGPTMALRRAAVKFLVKNSQDTNAYPKLGDADLLKFSHAIVFNALRFLVQYMETVSYEASCANSPPKKSRPQALAVHAAKGSVDSVLGVLKPLIATNHITWDEFDGLLQDCVKPIFFVESWAKRGDLDTPHDINAGQYIIKISNLYWAFQSHRSKSCSNDASGGAIEALIRSVDLLRSRSGPEKESGLFVTKLEKLIAALDALGQFHEAKKRNIDAINACINRGSLREATELAANNALHIVWASDGQIGQFARLLQFCSKRTRHEQRMSQGIESYLDDFDRIPAERGILLEQQLHLVLMSLSPHRPFDPHVVETVHENLAHLFSIYTSSLFPVRRRRVQRTVLRLATDYPVILNDHFSSLAMEDHLAKENVNLGSDVGLQRFLPHVQAGWKVGKCFLLGLPRFEEIEPALLTWQSIVETSLTWNALLEKVDDVEYLETQLQVVAGFLDMQGLEMQRLAILSMISRIEELRKRSDPAELISRKTELALQYLRLGYAGKGSTHLTEVRALVSLSSIPASTKLRFQIVEAECCLDKANFDKS